MIELAYWIGPTPGQWDEEIEERHHLEWYRDRREETRARWVVLHLHFDESPANMQYLFRDATIGGTQRTIVGIVSHFLHCKACLCGLGANRLTVRHPG